LQELDSIIGSLHQKFEKQWSDVGHIASTLAAAPQLLTTVQQLMEQIGPLFGTKTFFLESNYDTYKSILSEVPVNYIMYTVNLDYSKYRWY
jgi:hypothetical protein